MKKQLAKTWDSFNSVSYWLFFGIAAISLVIALLALRHNNVTALKLRNEVNKVDQANGDVETALRNLRTYIYSHMNTNLASGPNAIKPPIQLKYRYDRLVEAQKNSQNADTAKLYTDAQNYCELQFPHGLSGSGRIPCITNYLTTHGGSSVPSIPEDLYKFDFVSPTWSPDLAGWSLVIFATSLIAGLGRLVLDKWLRYELKQNA